jgi:hypothetical protein
MHVRMLPALLALALVTPTAVLAQTPAPTAARAPAPTAARAPTPAPPSAASTRPAAPRAPAPAPSRSPARAEPDLVQTATQVLQGVLQDGESDDAAARAPRARPRGENELPTDLLERAGLDPRRLPGALGPALRADPTGTERLSPTQLQQLARLARRNATLRQLRSVTDAYLRAGRSDAAEETESHPVLSATELSRVVTRATGGASPVSLGRLVTSLLAE